MSENEVTSLSKIFLRSESDESKKEKLFSMMENYFHICSKVFHLTKSRRNTNNSKRTYIWNFLFSRALSVGRCRLFGCKRIFFLSFFELVKILCWKFFFRGQQAEKEKNPGNNNEMKVYFYTLNLYNFQTTIERRIHSTNELTINHGVKWDGIAIFLFLSISIICLYRLLG